MRLVDRILDVPWNTADYLLGKFLDWNYHRWEQANVHKALGIPAKASLPTELHLPQSQRTIGPTGRIMSETSQTRSDYGTASDRR